MPERGLALGGGDGDEPSVELPGDGAIGFDLERGMVLTESGTHDDRTDFDTFHATELQNGSTSNVTDQASCLRLSRPRP